MEAQRPWSKALPEDRFDDIVIGSGMGGMTAAALLAHAGRRVLVLEQHWTPGGFTHTFRRGPHVWDVGVHAVGEVTRHSMVGRLLETLTDGHLKWSSLGPVYDEFHFPDGFRIDFPDHPEKFRSTLLDAFPDEAPAIDNYLATVREVASSMRGYYLSRTLPNAARRVAEATIGRSARRWFDRTCQSVLNEITDNPKLRTVLSAQWGYYGVPPSRASFAVQALVTRHYLYGGYYPAGGSRSIAEGLLGAVARRGGWTSVRRDVRRIRVSKGRAIGVELSTGESLDAERVISAVGVMSTVERLLDPDVRTDGLRRGLRNLRPSAAHVCLYLGFDRNPAFAGASAANRWFYETWDSDEDAWQVDPERSAWPPAPVLYTSFPSLKDPEHTGSFHTAEVVTFVPWRAFARWSGTEWRKRGPGYAEMKERMQTALLEQLLLHMPELRSAIRVMEFSTPLSTENFARPMAGSIYGLQATPERFKNPHLLPRSPVDGLYFAGSDVATMGVVGAMMGGLLAALAAEPLAVGRMVRRVA